MLCLDLRCNERLESTTNLAGRSILDENKRLIERMSRFASEALGIDFTASPGRSSARIRPSRRASSQSSPRIHSSLRVAA